MIVFLGRYRTNIPFIKTIYDREIKRHTVERIISECAVSTGVPVIAVTFYVGELYGFTPEIYTMIEKFKTFYNYKEVRE